MPLFYDGMDSPLGPLWFAVSDGLSADGGVALAWVRWGMSETAFRREVAQRSDLAPKRDPDRLRGWRRQIADYFAGRRIDFDGSIAPEGGTPFQRQVWEQIRTIPYGRVRSYAEIARSMGLPGAARAVGAACGKNPVPIVVPCHRVVRQDGSLGGYTGGLHIKKTLLRIEGIDIQD